MNHGYTFHPGIVVDPGRMRPNLRPRIVPNRNPTTHTAVSESFSTKPTELVFMTYEERRTLPPALGKLRLLGPVEEYPSCVSRYWNTDLSLKEWINELTMIQKQYTDQTINSVLYPPNFLDTLQSIFIRNQSRRFLAFKVYRIWSQRVWGKRTQCNVALIDMEPIAEKDAIYLTDTKHHQIFRFHRGDVFKNLLSNIGSCDDTLPSPRTPTNPWTNEPLTLQQTLHICHQLIVWYAEKGSCPPVLFTAFCSAGYNIRTFRYKYASILAQHAITTYFAELTPENRDVVEDTIVQLLYAAGCLFSPQAFRSWIQSTPTALHREWLSFVRDYTLYMNLHVQVRQYWYNQTYIRMDIRRLFDRSHFFREIVRQGSGSVSDQRTPVATTSIASTPVATPDATPLTAEAESQARGLAVTYALYPLSTTSMQFYDPNQLLGLMLSSDLEGSLSDLLLQAQRMIDEQMGEARETGEAHEAGETQETQETSETQETQETSDTNPSSNVPDTE